MKIKRIFECKNGHRYKSKQPITTPVGGAYTYTTPNDMCKICGATIISEMDFVNGKIVMGAMLIS